MTKAEKKARKQWLKYVAADLNELEKTFKRNQSSRAQTIRNMAGSLKRQVQAAKTDVTLSTRKIERDLRRLMELVSNSDRL